MPALNGLSIGSLRLQCFVIIWPPLFERIFYYGTNQSYNADSISVLEGLEAVRKRPGMYIGSVSRKGLNHLVYEIVDNSVDEHLAGFCSEIHVTLNKDGSATVSDNGRGIPVGMHKKAFPRSVLYLQPSTPEVSLMILPTRQAAVSTALAHLLSTHCLNGWM